jgi:hypothetical protein
MMGVVIRALAGNLPGTVTIFSDPAKEVSTHSGIARDGSARQFGPAGKGWIAPGRGGQRREIIARAMAIRAGVTTYPRDGTLSLTELAAQPGTGRRQSRG